MRAGSSKPAPQGFVRRLVSLSAPQPKRIDDAAFGRVESDDGFGIQFDRFACKAECRRFEVVPTRAGARHGGRVRADDHALDNWDSIMVGTEVKGHMKYLKLEDQQILFRRFVLDDDHTRTDVTARKQVQRAIDRLTLKLNLFASNKSECSDELNNGHPGAPQCTL